MFPTRKAAAFAATIASVGALVLALSVYKVAVANAFLRPPPPGDEDTVRAAWVAALPAPTPAARTRGEHLLQLVGCADCHGADYGGRVLVDQPGVWTLTAPNLTPGRGGVTLGWDAARWRQALRYGVDTEWRALWGMPRHALLQLADDDVAALRAALLALPPVDHTLPQSKLGLVGYVRVAARQLRVVERDALPTRASGAFWEHAPAAQDIGFGRYLAGVGRCQHCHDAGGPQAATPVDLPRPEAPALAALARAPNGEKTWRQRLRAGRCPDGQTPEQRAAPSRLHGLTDDEAEALRQVFAAAPTP